MAGTGKTNIKHCNKRVNLGSTLDWNNGKPVARNSTLDRWG